MYFAGEEVEMTMNDAYGSHLYTTAVESPTSKRREGTSNQNNEEVNANGEIVLLEKKMEMTDNASKIVLYYFLTVLDANSTAKLHTEEEACAISMQGNAAYGVKRGDMSDVKMGEYDVCTSVHTILTVNESYGVINSLAVDHTHSSKDQSARTQYRENPDVMERQER